MSEINIPREERIALKEVDMNALAQVTERCLYEKNAGPLHALGLWSCGPFTASKLRDYENALSAYSGAKARKKVDETESRARRAGDDLAFAIRQMKERVETEEKEDTLFHIEDHIIPPHRFSEEMTVRVAFRWRAAIEDEWAYGAIVFSHTFSERIDFTLPRPKGKPSAVASKRDQQDKLYREWEHLKSLGLYSVKEHFRTVGSGASIPQKFKAITDQHGGGLNNHSLKFWLPCPLG